MPLSLHLAVLNFVFLDMFRNERPEFSLSKSSRTKARRKVTFWLLPLAYVLINFASNSRKLENNISIQNASISAARHLLQERECVPPAVNEFPADFLTQDERIGGGIVFHIFITCYMCYVLAIVCDEYFIPSLEGISQALDLPSDVAGATFMAAGTSAPELFTSVVGVFITEGDLGVGTIVGSAVFNILAVVSVCGLLAGVAVPLDWWPLTRDCAAYMISVVILIVLLQDDEVHWYEALVLIIMFFLYILVMYFNQKLESICHRLVLGCGNCCKRKRDHEKDPLLPPHKDHRTRTYSALSEHSHYGSNPKLDKDIEASEIGIESAEKHPEKIQEEKIEDAKENPQTLLPSDQDTVMEPIRENEDEEKETATSPWHISDGGISKKFCWFIMWPATLIFYITIPDCRKPRWQKCFPVTFIIAVAYIAVLSYLLSWMVTIIGHTFGIPDTVMGLTFLAAGTSVPEAISSVIVCRQGFGNMAISNSVGSNVFDILFCLGLPWFIKSLMNGSRGYSVHINSGGLEYSVIALLTTVVVMFGAVACNNFRLDRRVGLGCLVMYGIFLVVSSLFELNVFGVVNLPTCPD